ncbi:MAG: DUF5695 domain-containing protein [Gemmatimonadota bacterium]
MAEKTPAGIPHTDEPLRLSRRNFLQSAGLAGAGLALNRPVDAAAAGLDVGREGSLRPASQFDVTFADGAIVGLKYVGDEFDTDYVQSDRRLGDAVVRYRRGAGEWLAVDTSAPADGERTVLQGADGRTHAATYRVTDGGAPVLELKLDFIVEDDVLRWNATVANLTAGPVEVGDLAFPLPMNSSFREHPTTAVLKHSFISGDGSFLFWMRRNSVGPYLTMLPTAGTKLEYWESQGGYRMFVHSAASGAAAAERGTDWRQPHTSAMLAPQGSAGATQAYGFTLHWAADYDDVRRLLVDEGLIDTHIVPGMTVPSDQFARIALRTRHPIAAVEAEHPVETQIRPLGARGDAQIYEVRFSRLGENRLTVRYGDGRHMHLEFFSTEPVETMIAKRAAFIASHQIRDDSLWYDGLLAEWNNETQVQLSPDNYDRIRGWRIYAVTCDDPGLSKPAYLASKNAEHPVQDEVGALDYYIENFVWGGLQRTTDELFEYGIYGIPDWKQNRESDDPGRNGRKHIWRIYDYPHIALMYHSMYRIAKHNPQIRTALGADQYLRRAYATAVAMFTIPYEIERWSAYQTGLYNELVIPDIIDALDAEGLPEHAEHLRMHWERKVRAFINDRPDLFRSEYAFDSTGFESTHALVKYAATHADRLAQERPSNDRMPPVTPDATANFLEMQMQANLFCRGWLEPAYYYLGSDYRGGGGDRYTLTYMSQMGGWSVLDYALHFAADPAPYLRLGYASILSSWALLNSGTPESKYGYWFPGEANDGAAGGGFEPSPFGNTWLEQPHTRGSWYYSCEIDLGFCGGLRGARTVVADDPIFGRFAFGGELTERGGRIEVVPNDGVRRRFHALLEHGRVHLELDTGRFAAGRPVVLDEDLATIRFQLESDNPEAHTVRLSVAGVDEGLFAVQLDDARIGRLSLQSGEAGVVELAIPAARQRTGTFSLVRA